VERTIERVRQEWKKAEARPQPHAEGWNAYFDAAPVFGLAFFASSQFNCLFRTAQTFVTNPNPLI
jgi:hypothetical protein